LDRVHAPLQTEAICWLEGSWRDCRGTLSNAAVKHTAIQTRRTTISRDLAFVSESDVMEADTKLTA
jgi:hypothetical protein